jgi:hypothetical protein
MARKAPSFANLLAELNLHLSSRFLSRHAGL